MEHGIIRNKLRFGALAESEVKNRGTNDIIPVGATTKPTYIGDSKVSLIPRRVHVCVDLYGWIVMSNTMHTFQTVQLEDNLLVSSIARYAGYWH